MSLNKFSKIWFFLELGVFYALIFFLKVFCLDGDGAAIMHMGNMSSIGQNGSENFKHILFNNGAHDSVGGQLTDAYNDSFSFTKIALGCGYKEVSQCIDYITTSINFFSFTYIYTQKCWVWASGFTQNQYPKTQIV